MKCVLNTVKYNITMKQFNISETGHRHYFSETGFVVKLLNCIFFYENFRLSYFLSLHI